MKVSATAAPTLLEHYLICCSAAMAAAQLFSLEIYMIYMAEDWVQGTNV